MKLKAAGLIRLIISSLGRLERFLYIPAQNQRVRPWFAAKGDEILRLDYDLQPDAVVLDAGGYKGQWSSDIFAKYLCRIHIFEPVADYARFVARRFEKNSKISVYALGLAGQTRKMQIAVCKDSSSVFRNGVDDTVEIQLVSAEEIFQELKINHIDLLKINIEGGEYELLEHLLETERVRHIKNIQVQFHDIFPDAKERMKKLQSELSQTHELTYQFMFVWENWRRKR